MIKLHPLFIALAAAGFAASTMAQMPDGGSAAAQLSPSERSPIYIVKFSEPGLLYNVGQIGGFERTAPSQTGSRKLNVYTDAALAYRKHLAEQQDQYLSAMSSRMQRPLEVLHHYDVTMNGVALRMTKDEAELIRNLAGIQSVEQEVIYEMDTDAGPAFIGAPSVWDGSMTPTAIGTRGQNVVVGVFDSGGNPDHPSFANDATCGHSVPAPKLIATKDCNTANCATGNGEDVSFFVDENNTGSSGHGVHTASTAAGSAVAGGTLVNGFFARYNISGVAPCARVITYKVCGTTAPSGTAGCGGAAIAAAIQTSITDQVDVVNFSISGGGSPWGDNDRGFLDMVNADILVAASAGNTRASTPNPVANVAHRGPWVMTVANSTHDRFLAGDVSVAGSLQNVPGQSGGGPDIALTTAPVAVASVLGNETGCTATGAFPAGSMTGKIALIARGACAFVEKVENATTAGANSVVMYMADGTAPILMGGLDATTIGAMMISRADGIAFRDFVTANPTANGTIFSGRVFDTSQSDVLNSSSLRGPNNSFDVTKPDITGPGTNIYAASSGSFSEFAFLTGTSMSSPHLAGAGALVRSAQPSWTPQEVKSALQLTAVVAGKKDDAVTPWDADDVGNGRVDMTRATRSGLVMNETFANFLAANPSTAGADAVRQLNLPSMRHTAVAGSYVFTRTFRNAMGVPALWTAVTTGAPAGTTVSVSPSSFSFGTSTAQTQTVQITVTLNQAVPTLSFGDVVFAPTLVVVPNPDAIFGSGFEEPLRSPEAARLTIAVRGTTP